MPGVNIDPKAFERAYVTDVRYRDYMLDKADEIIRASKSAFLMLQRADNEWRLSVTTPPKYLSAFKREIDLSIQTSYAINVDPAWNLVEWGAHPGGDPDTFVLAYKPMTRGLEMVAALHQQ
jgi:hypothetical protein